MAVLKITFKGQAEMAKAIRTLARKYPDKIKGALVLWAERVMTVSKSEYVPVKEGTLRDSGRVTPMGKGVIGVTLSYGGAASAYAVAQHENEKYRHEHGSAGYLRIPMMEAAATAAEDIAKNCQLSDEDVK